MTIEGKTEHSDFDLGDGQLVSEFKVDSRTQRLKFAGHNFRISDRGSGGGSIGITPKETVLVQGDIDYIAVNRHGNTVNVEILTGGEVAVVVGSTIDKGVSVDQAKFKHIK